MGQSGWPVDDLPKEPHIPAMRTRRPGILFVVLATLILTCLVTLASMGTPGAPRFAVLHERQNVTWLIWAVLSPAIILVARRFPFGGGSATQWLLRHVAIGLAFSAIAASLMAAHHAMQMTPASMAPEPPLVSTIATGLLIYTLIAVSYQALAYHGTARAQEADAARLRADLAEARLHGLESKMQPHFLFNALNSVTALLRRDPAAAEEMLEQVSELLRASLRANPLEEVPFSDALHLAEQYLAIERVRYGDRLRVEINVGDAARRCRVPQLLLQPLVENAVRHGIAPLEDGGTVCVAADVRDAMLTITVEDDGIGYDSARMQVAAAGNGIGLRSIRTALEHLYGARHVFDVRAREPRGTIARIELPCREGAA